MNSTLGSVVPSAMFIIEYDHGLAILNTKEFLTETNRGQQYFQQWQPKRAEKEFWKLRAMVAKTWQGKDLLGVKRWRGKGVIEVKGRRRRWWRVWQEQCRLLLLGKE